MTVVIISMGVFLLAAAGLSLGLLLGRGGIRGSCRAMESAPGDACACAEPCPRRKRALAAAARRDMERPT
jgi:hypothetical protein